jgi:hypothetical protein
MLAWLGGYRQTIKADQAINGLISEYLEPECLSTYISLDELCTRLSNWPKQQSADLDRELYTDLL